MGVSQRNGIKFYESAIVFNIHTASGINERVKISLCGVDAMGSRGGLGGSVYGNG